jgi:hypothetical protein
MQITSTAFEHNQEIPSKYTCDGENVNPPLDFIAVPNEAVRLALIVDDPDAAVGDWTHWLVWNLAPSTLGIEENSIPGVEGITDFKNIAYGGPCPSQGKHRYFFKLYALDTKLDLAAGATKKDLEAAMNGHIIGKAELIGLYERL